MEQAGQQTCFNGYNRRLVGLVTQLKRGLLTSVSVMLLTS